MAKKQSNSPSIYWHDYETFGINPKTDRPSQFAGIRTDLNLNIISDPLMIYAKPSDDFLPDPQACLITGITPQLAKEKGIIEVEFIKTILTEFSRSNTCVAGYNSLRFDDEFTRYTLYRNLLPAYDREWQNGNSRWDIIDLVRVTHALRPDGINWPTYEDGTPSYRLEHLTKANGLSHEAAHDALSDVTATIAVAKLIKEKQPALYDYYFNNRLKREVAKRIDVVNKKPILHTSSMFPREFYCTALVVPLIQHPTNSNGIVCFDLRHDPSDLITLSSSEIRERLYSKADSLPEGQSRIPLKTIHLNKCPVVVPAKIDHYVESRLSIDKQKSFEHLEMIRRSEHLEQKLIEVFKHNPFEPETDPDQSLYSGGFFSDRDKQQMATIHQLDPYALVDKSFDFADDRLDEMLFRYRARNYPETLLPDEQEKWQNFRVERLSATDAAWMTSEKLSENIKTLQTQQPADKDNEILDSLLTYNNELRQNIENYGKVI